MILCIGTTPAAQRVMIFRQFALGSVNRAATTLDGAAGKSINVAKVLQALGAAPTATGFLGGDRGRELQKLLDSRVVDSEFVAVSTSTRQCVTVIDESTGTVTELVEESQPVDPADYEKLLSIIRRRMPQCEAVVMSGTIARGGPADFYYQCTCRANEVGILSIIDAAGPALQEALKAKPGLVKPNWAELEATVGKPLSDPAAAALALRELHARGAHRVVVTAGPNPTLAFDGAQFFIVKPPNIRALNPIGSGDAFTAGLVWQLTRGADLPEACRWASAAGAANALTAMPGELSREDVERLAPAVQICLSDEPMV